MKAYLLKKTGSAEVLRISDVEKPIPAPGEVRVKVKTIGLNYAEILSRKGIYGWAPRLPYILGMECYGIIESVGKNVKRKPGEKVLVGGQYGSYAEYVVCDEKLALKALPGLSDAEQAGVLVNFMTAYTSLFELARLRSSDKVLITSAAGGVGSAAVMLAKAFGCEVAGVAGGKEKTLRRLGAFGADYRKNDWEKTLKKKFPGGFDVILEMVGGDIYKKSLEMLAPAGKIVIGGLSSIDYKKWNPLTWVKALRLLPKFNLQDMMLRSYGISSIHLGYMLKDQPRLLRVWEDLYTFMKKHKLRPLIDREFSFKEAPEAQTYIENRKNQGKVVLNLEK